MLDVTVPNRSLVVATIPDDPILWTWRSVQFEFIHFWPVSSVVKLVVIGAGGLALDSRADQIGLNVANGSPPLRRFFGAVLHRRKTADMGRATRYKLQRNIAGTMKVWFLKSERSIFMFVQVPVVHDLFLDYYFTELLVGCFQHFYFKFRQQFFPRKTETIFSIRINVG